MTLEELRTNILIKLVRNIGILVESKQREGLPIVFTLQELQSLAQHNAGDLAQALAPLLKLGEQSWTK